MHSLCMRQKSKKYLKVKIYCQFISQLWFLNFITSINIDRSNVITLVNYISKLFHFSAFGEAFLATYRTFIEPHNLVEKLTHRYSFFNKHINDQKQKAAKETFRCVAYFVFSDVFQTKIFVSHFQSFGARYKWFDVSWIFFRKFSFC